MSQIEVIDLQSNAAQLIDEQNESSSQTQKKKRSIKGAKKIKKKTEGESLKVGAHWKNTWVKQAIDKEGSQFIFIKRWIKIIEKENQQPSTPKSTPQIISNKQSFECEFKDCGKVFKDSCKLKKHLVVHQEKQFICRVDGCNKEFLDKSKLQRHRLVHTKERHYQCEICLKRFSLDFNLKTHMRTHTGQKPFACDYPNCNKRFSQSSNLASHKKNHKDEEEKMRKIKLKEIKKINAIKSKYEDLYEVLQDTEHFKELEVFKIRSFEKHGVPLRMQVQTE